MDKYTLNFSSLELIKLKVLLETRIGDLLKHGLNADIEVSILKKVYEIIPHVTKKFENI